MDTKQRLSHLTISLHWLIALTMIGLTALGLYMKNYEAHDWYPLHKAIGVVIAGFIIVRVFWRYANGWPKAVRQYPVHEQWMAHAVHWLLIVGTVLMPVSGMMMSGLGGHGINVFGWQLMPVHTNASGEHTPFNAFAADLGENLHTMIGYMLVGAIALHIIGALKHHIVDKDATLTRMLGRVDKS